uniref:Secreted protein n=1 Tax=Rhabditophanes sp. KR3021 TaxID=114890 RepID=A0AC35U1P4_9BILA
MMMVILFVSIVLVSGNFTYPHDKGSTAKADHASTLIPPTSTAQVAPALPPPVNTRTSLHLIVPEISQITNCGTEYCIQNDNASFLKPIPIHLFTGQVLWKQME